MFSFHSLSCFLLIYCKVDVLNKKNISLFFVCCLPTYYITVAILVFTFYCVSQQCPYIYNCKYNNKTGMEILKFNKKYFKIGN